MLTFLIVMAVMLLIFQKDFRLVRRDGQKKVTVFYSVAMGMSVAVIALYCFWGNLAGV